MRRLLPGYAKKRSVDITITQYSKEAVTRRRKASAWARRENQNTRRENKQASRLREAWSQKINILLTFITHKLLRALSPAIRNK